MRLRRSRLSPSRMTPGASLADWSARRACGVDVGARLPQEGEDGHEVDHVERDEDHDGQQQGGLVGERVPPDQTTGDQRSGGDAAPTRVPCAARAPSTSAPGSVACTVSTNHASSGPESRARKTPMRHAARANIQNVCATR